MKKLIFVQLSFLFSLFISAKIEVLDRVAIIVNDGVIMESQVDDLVESTRLRFLEQGAEPPPASSLIEEIKEQLIVKELQLQKGLEFGVRISDGELNQTFFQIAQNNGLTLEQFIKNIQDSGQNYEKIREEVREDMIIQRVQRGVVSNSINITDQEIEGFLATEEAVDQLTPELLVRQIQLDSVESAEEVLRDLENGGNFEVIAIEKNKKSKKEIQVSRSFGTPVTKLEDLTQALATHAIKASEKMRSQNLQSSNIRVFARTSKYSSQNYQRSAHRKLTNATDDTNSILKIVVELSKEIYNPEYKFSKAGVLMQDLTNSEYLQQSVINYKSQKDLKKSANLMRTIDLLNKRFNNNAITWAITKNPQSWKMNKNFLSRSSTTDIEQIPTIVK